MTISNADKDSERLDNSYIIIENVNGIATLWNTFLVSHKTKRAAMILTSNCTVGHLFQRNKIHSHKTYTRMFRAILPIRARHRKWPRYNAMAEWLNILYYILTIEY